MVDDESDVEMPWRALGTTAVVFAVIVIGFIYLTRPVWHGLIYGLVYKAPGSLQWLAVGSLLWVYASVRNRPVVRLAAIAVLVLGVFLVGPLASSIYAQEHIANERVGPNTADIETLPETDAEHPRLLPRSVGKEYAQNSLQYPRHKLGGGDITKINGSLHWSYSLAPDGALNSLFIQQRGAVFANMETMDKDVSVTEKRMPCGEGMAITDNYQWKMQKDRYWVSHQSDDTFAVKHDDGDLTLATPYITHEYHFRLTPIPQVYTTPEFSGVATVDSECRIDHLSKQEALQSNLLEGQNFYPYDLARFEVNSMRYQHGAVNKWLFHEDELEIASVPGDGNDQPFTVQTEGGLKYIIAVEPWGEAQGIYQIWVTDARTGERELYQQDMKNSMLGPQKASNYVRKANPIVDWNRMEPSEPIPVVVDGDLYWEVRVVPSDSAGVAYTSFVNADTGDVFTVETGDKARAFLRGEDVPETPENGSDNRQSPGDQLVVTIQYANGTKENITVDANSSVTIRQREANQS